MSDMEEGVITLPQLVFEVGPGDVVLISLPFATSPIHAERNATKIAEGIGNGVRVVVLDCAKRYEVIAVFRHRHEG